MKGIRKDLSISGSSMSPFDDDIHKFSFFFFPFHTAVDLILFSEKTFYWDTDGFIRVETHWIFKSRDYSEEPRSKYPREKHMDIYFFMGLMIMVPRFRLMFGILFRLI
jgi:hypothetical protein